MGSGKEVKVKLDQCCWVTDLTKLGSEGGSATNKISLEIKSLTLPSRVIAADLQLSSNIIQHFYQGIFNKISKSAIIDHYYTPFAPVFIRGRQDSNYWRPSWRWVHGAHSVSKLRAATHDIPQKTLERGSYIIPRDLAG